MSGPYRVGYKSFTSKDLGNECSVFYPAADDNSGYFGAPFLVFPEEQLKAYQEIARIETKKANFLIRWLAPLLVSSWTTI